MHVQSSNQQVQQYQKQQCPAHVTRGWGAKFCGPPDRVRQAGGRTPGPEKNGKKQHSGQGSHVSTKHKQSATKQQAQYRWDDGASLQGRGERGRGRQTSVASGNEITVRKEIGATQERIGGTRGTNVSTTGEQNKVQFGQTFSKQHGGWWWRRWRRTYFHLGTVEQRIRGLECSAKEMEGTTGSPGNETMHVSTKIFPQCHKKKKRRGKKEEPSRG